MLIALIGANCYLFPSLIATSEVEYTPKELEEFQRLLRSAARDCIPQERNSFVAFQANTGVEVYFEFDLSTSHDLFRF